MMWTVGHSNRSLEEFVRLLRAYGLTMVVDVRKMPGSRRNPQFNRETLSLALQAAGIEYRDMPGLGGLRPPRPDSPNTGWNNASFRGYADYMLTPEFEASLEELLEQAAGRSVALMCAEAVPWRCHRSLIADALVVRGIPVEHILSPSRAQPHRLHPWACVKGTRLTYPPTVNPSPSRTLIKEKQMPLEHSRPEREARFAAGSLHTLTLETVARELRQEPSYQKSGRNGTTLVKTPRLRQVLEVLRAGAALEEHTAPGPITVQLLHGEVRFEAGTESVQLKPGQLLSLPSERPHRVEAVEDSAFLLTIEMEEPNSGVVFGPNFHERG